MEEAFNPRRSDETRAIPLPRSFLASGQEATSPSCEVEASGAEPEREPAAQPIVKTRAAVMKSGRLRIIALPRARSGSGIRGSFRIGQPANRGAFHQDLPL